MTALAEFQAELGEDGLLVGRDQPITLVTLEGVADRDIRARDTDRELADGAVMGPDYGPPRTVILTLKIKGSSAAAAMATYADVEAAWNSTRGPERAQSTLPFRWRLPGQAARRLDGGRPRHLAIDPTTLGTSRLIIVGTYYAPDPRMRSDAEHVIDLDMDVDAETLPNAGNHPASVWWDVYGAVTSPGLIRSEAVRFDIPGVTIPNGTLYRLRTDPRTVIRSSDSANRYQDVTCTPSTGTPFLEVPAGGALFRAVGTAPGVNAKIRATYRDTWL